MIVVSFRASNNRFLVVNEAGRLEARAEAPGIDTEFLVENLTRPNSERFATDDKLEIRSVSSNGLWRMNPPPSRSTRGPISMVADRPFPAWSKTKSEHFVVTSVSEDLEGNPIIGLQAIYPSMVLATGGGGGSVDAETVFRDGFEILHERTVHTDRSGLLNASLSMAGPTTNFTVVRHLIRAAFRTPSGLYLTLNSDGRLVGVLMDSTRAQEFTFALETEDERSFLLHGDVFRLRASNGNKVSSSTRGVDAVGNSGHILQLRRIEGEGPVRDGDQVTLSQFEISRSSRTEPKRLTVRPVTDGRSGRLSFERGAGLDVSTLIIEFTRPLGLFWNPRTQDNITGIGTRAGGEIEFVRPQMRALLLPRPGAVPLKTFFHEGRGDTMTTATIYGERAALDVTPPYQFRGILGYVHGTSQVGTVPLKQYWHGGRGDNFLCAQQIDEQSAASAGYEFVSVEGHAPLVNTPAVPRTPFLDSPAAMNVVFGSGKIPSLSDALKRPFSSRPRRALVLSGGGAKGCFEAGAIQELWRNGYRPDFICGVSVGAINASYLALGHDSVADELVNQWRQFSAGPGRIYRQGHYINVIGKLAERVAGRAGDTALATAAGAGFGAAIGALIGFFSGREASGMDGAMVRLINFLLTMTHAQHSMEPLRRLLQSTMNADYLRRLRESSVGLHVTMTDMKSGHLVTVSGPESNWSDSQIADCGRVFVEHDHQIGDTWLTRPLFGTPYVMPLVDAVYASSALPGFMEPLLINLLQCRQISTSAGVFTRLATGLPAGLRELIDSTNAVSERDQEHYLDGINWEQIERLIDRLLGQMPTAQLRNNVSLSWSARDGSRGAQSQTHLFFDGGLRDTLPIRTAMRLGADEIMVITGDQLHRAQHVYPVARKLDPNLAGGALDLIGGGAFHGTDFGATPLAHHVLGLLGLWFNESSRSDLMLSLEHSDQLSWLRRALDRMDPASASAIRTAFRDEVARRTSIRYEATGATGPIGGNPSALFPYGEPFSSQGPSIKLIAPDRDFIDALDFENNQAIEDGISLGAQRAKSPVSL